MRCCVEGRPYTVFGYRGKQVRDNIHAGDLVGMFWHWCQNPRSGTVYNVGGGWHCRRSIVEAGIFCEEIARRQLQWCYDDQARIRDHVWYVSDVSKFRGDYPDREYQFDLRQILVEICEAWRARKKQGGSFIPNDSASAQ